MLTLRKATDRFHTRIDWLDSWHSFSFGDHYDPRHMGFGSLRVINDDRIAAAGGFPEHPHRDMEIITVVLEGVLAHKDSLGTGSVIKPGDVQKMSAGAGIRHSEFNASKSEGVHLLQIWIVPQKNGIAPSYAQVHFAPEKRRDRLCLAVSMDGAGGSILLHQDARLYISDMSPGKSLKHAIAEGRKAWVQLADGALDVNGIPMQAGDGLAVTAERELTLAATAESKVLLFDLGS